MKKLLVAILFILAVSSVSADTVYGYAYGNITCYSIDICTYEVFCVDFGSVAYGDISHAVDPNAYYTSCQIYPAGRTYDFVCVFYNSQSQVIARDLVEDVYVPIWPITHQKARVDFNQ